MGEITPKCAGCVWLTEPLAPECKTCVNNNHYSYRKHNFGVEKEIAMVTIEPIKLPVNEKKNMISHITKKLRVIADDLGLELYPTTRLSKGELWVIFFNPTSHKARKIFFNEYNFIMSKIKFNIDTTSCCLLFKIGLGFFQSFNIFLYLFYNYLNIHFQL